MQLRFGNLSFNVNGCDVRTQVQAVLRAGRPVRYVRRMFVSGELEGDTQASLSTQESILRAFLEDADPRTTIALYTDAGGASASQLVGSQSISGLRVLSYSFDNTYGGAEYATIRSFNFVVEAEYIASGMRGTVLSFTESVTVTGTGGPVTRMRAAVNAPPVKQIVYPSSVVRATQTGQAVGHVAYPTPTLPLWPLHELVDQRTVSRTTPDFAGSDSIEFSTQWVYQFEAAVSLSLNPNVFPR